MPATYFASYAGLGDHLYMRPFVLAKAESSDDPVYVMTPWPRAYDHPGVRFVRMKTPLRTQLANMQSLSDKVWSELPSEFDRITPNYMTWALQPADGTTITAGLEKQMGFAPGFFSLTVNEVWKRNALRALTSAGYEGDRPLCLFHPTTIRKEWMCPARNPDARYMQQLFARISERWFTLAVGWLEPHQEELYMPQLSYSAEYMHGQLHWTTIAALMQIADLVVTAPGFMTPLGCAVGARMFTVFGGHIPPTVLFDERMGLERIGWAAPKDFCYCVQGRHQCNKEIGAERLDSIFNRFLEETS